MNTETTDRDALEKKRKQAREADEWHLINVRKVLATPEGRSVLCRYIEESGYFGPSFSLSHASASFREGERHIGRKIVADVGLASPEVLTQMLVEHIKASPEARNE